ncbi:MAG: Kelch repeat-containing protein [bacterium]
MKRYSHTLNYYESSCSIVIHGGYSESTQAILKDLHMLNLQTMAW